MDSKKKKRKELEIRIALAEDAYNEAKMNFNSPYAITEKNAIALCESGMMSEDERDQIIDARKKLKLMITMYPKMIEELRKDYYKVCKSAWIWDKLKKC